MKKKYYITIYRDFENYCFHQTLSTSSSRGVDPGRLFSVSLSSLQFSLDLGWCIIGHKDNWAGVSFNEWQRTVIKSTWYRNGRRVDIFTEWWWLVKTDSPSPCFILYTDSRLGPMIFLNLLSLDRNIADCFQHKCISLQENSYPYEMLHY